MQYCWGGKKSKRVSPGSNFTEQIFAGELSGVVSAAVLRQSVFNSLMMEDPIIYVRFVFTILKLTSVQIFK